MNVAQAAQRTGQTARMLRYREALGLVSPARSAEGHRVYRPSDLEAVALGLDLEHRYGVTPAGLGFAVRALDDPDLALSLRRLARLAGGDERVRILDFETHKARRLLGLAS